MTAIGRVVPAARPRPASETLWLGYSAAPSYDYMPALDGLRAVSVVLVVLSHFGLRRYVPGGFGVTAFFFISGFLITRQVLAEQSVKGQLDLGQFYIRRLLRLYPALLVMLACAATIGIALGARITGGQVAAGIFYYTNINTLFVPYLSAPEGMYHPLGVLWSLAVEEHYYLVYPALIFLVGRTRMRLALVLCLVIVAVTLWRQHLADACVFAIPPCRGDNEDSRILQGTDTRLDSILYGAVLATVLGTRLAGPVLRVLNSRLVFLAGIAMLLASFLVRDPVFRDGMRFTVQGIGLTCTIGSALFSPHLGWIRTALSVRPALLIGRWSYSLYLWHSFVMLAVAVTLPDWVWRPAVQDGAISFGWTGIGMPLVLAGSIAVAATSYKFVEMPMVAIRRRFGSHAVRDSIPTP